MEATSRSQGNEREIHMACKPLSAGVGIAIGVGIGTAIGVALGNIAPWLAIGAGVGLLIPNLAGAKPN
jgi:hypothetical protein